MVFFALVAGVVVAVLLLKANGIIGSPIDKSAAADVDANAGSTAVGGNGP
jgi:hypothetical protein